MSLLISGPVAIDILTYSNIKIILLSDHHFSSEGICNTECSNEATPDAKCYTASGLIDKIIKEAKLKGQYVDVYLEAAYPEAFKARQLVIAQRERERELGLRPPATMSFTKHGLGLTIARYANCLYDKTLCQYTNARFHYVDVRRTTVDGDKGILGKIMTFYAKMLDSYPDVYKSRQDTITEHVEFFSFNFIIKTFLNTPRFMESNLFTYYNFVINSDNFTTDVESYLNLLLTADTQYVEKTIKLLVHRYPEYTMDFIRDAINKKITATFAWIRGRFLSPLNITERNIVIDTIEYKVNVHRIRGQLLNLELQGDNERAESLRQFIYRKFDSFNLLDAVELFDLYNEYRMLYITTGRIKKPPHESLIRSPFRALVTYGDIDTLMMDLYTLARMFRTYPQQYRKENKPLSQHILPSYIVEYAGGAHIDNIIEYFASIGIQKEIIAIKEDKRCLSVPSNIFD